MTRGRFLGSRQNYIIWFNVDADVKQRPCVTQCETRLRFDVETDDAAFIDLHGNTMREGVFTLSDAPSFSGLTSKFLPLGSMLNFDADVKKETARHECENPFTHPSLSPGSFSASLP